ncbi:MAG: DUF1759 domain-containing protein [Sphingobacteriaceae bacterium]|nr:MAG: DUF1759 domain-containing protein [Sphingobacteriaceae bacterium]
MDRFGKMSEDDLQSNANSRGSTPVRETSMEEGRLQENMERLEMIAGQIERQATFAGSPQFDELDMYTAQVRLETLESYATEYYSLFMSSMPKVSAENKQALQDRYNQIDDRRMLTAGLLRRLIKDEEVRYERRDKAEGFGKADTAQPNTVNVIMPAQSITNTWGYFDGEIMKWKGFRDRFKAQVHDKTDIKPADKFAHLKASLRGEAARAFGEWELNEASYNDAYERINSLYDRPYVVCTEHIHQLFKLPVLMKPATAAELQHMSNTTHEQIRQLKANGIPVEHWDMIICVILHDRLQNDTGRQWDLSRSSQRPTAKEMLDFLDKQAAALANVAPQRGHMSISVPNERATQRMDSGRKYGQASGGAIPKRYPCKVCGGDHPVFMCEQFLALNLAGRHDAVRRYGLCTNCLKSGHGPEVCHSTTCPDRRCRNAPSHNSKLCPFKQAIPPPVMVTPGMFYSTGNGSSSSSS